MAEAISASAGFQVQPQLFLSSSSQFNASGNIVRSINSALIDTNGSYLSPLVNGTLSVTGVTSSAKLYIGNDRPAVDATITGAPNFQVQILEQNSTAGSIQVGSSYVYTVRPPAQGLFTGYRAVQMLMTIDPLFPATFDGVALGLRSALTWNAPQSATSANTDAVCVTRSSLLYGSEFKAPATLSNTACLALSCDLQANSSGTVTTQRTLVIFSPTKSSSSTATLGTNTGIEILPQSLACTNQHSLRIGLASNGTSQNAAIHINSNTAGAGAGIVLGTSYDTSFWRGAASQLLTQGDWLSRHYLCSSTPTVAAGAGAGTSPTISIAGTDHGFAVTLTTGNPIATGTVFTVTFGASWTSSAPQVGREDGNANASALSGTSRPFTSAVSTTTMTFTSGSVALATATQYIWRFTLMR
jgi:hypothetical protein